MRKKTMLIWAAIVTTIVAAFTIWRSSSVPNPTVQQQGTDSEDMWSD